MTWLVAAIYDQVMRASEGACLAQWRSELVRSVAGEVLEVGAGTGAMLPHYPPLRHAPCSRRTRPLHEEAAGTQASGVGVSGAGIVGCVTGGLTHA